METELQRDGSSKNKIVVASLIFMGLSHILYLKQYIKGALYMLAECLMLACSPVIIRKITELITLGDPQPNIAVKLRDNSIFMLIDGVIIIVIIMLFFMLYIMSVRGALASYQDFCIQGRMQSNRESFGNVLGKSFPVLGLAPSVVLVMLFVLVPLIFSACVAFTDYSAPDHIPPNNTVNWVGFSNFATMFSGGTSWGQAFWRVAVWTLVWGLLATVTCYFGGLIMAVILKESKLRVSPLFRTIFILPYAVPSVVSMLVWQNLLNGSFGTVNRTLQAFGIIDGVIPWLSDPTLAKAVCIVVNLWAGFPYFMLMTMGTMTSISEDVFEAARIDGASQFQIFKRITLPLVMYQTMPLIIMSFTHNINNFGAIFFLTGGNPNVADSTITSAGGTDILVTWIYDLTITLMKYNYASVLAVLIFIVMAPFAIYNFRNTRSYKEGEL